MFSIIRFLIYVTTLTALSASTSGKSKPQGSSLNDDLFPIYQCDDRSRAWTKRCLVPLTNAQLSLDLCGTGEKVELTFVKGCAKELQILAKSCPQPGPLSSMAMDMFVHNPPPARPSAPSYESLNTPKVPKPKIHPETGDSKRDKWSL
ncbi:uncharacterized protein LOC131294132 [Anopheles ziemanni]|uniref:uncharacterized protein LOC131264858 n=1 Tax=Anopheles coustani TaxID=139045 RepID=UPI00265A0469|nr:uncharacterized protein LOC131264858 [Anopheles coustani]XP_058178160.1 uncharacterized protein LOC131294132 [Anopheles ziemanni]